MDFAAQEAVLRSVALEEEPLYPRVTLPPGVLDERRQKFTKVVLAVILGSALLVALAFLLGRDRGSRTLKQTEPLQERVDSTERDEQPPPPPEDDEVPGDPEETLMNDAQEAAVANEASAVEIAAPRAPEVKPQGKDLEAPARVSTPPADKIETPTIPVVPTVSDVPAPAATPATPAASRAVEQAKATRKPSENPPSAGFPDP